MGSVHAVGTKGKDLRYRARWRTPEGASRTRTFDRKTDAVAFLATVEHTKVSGTYVDTMAGAITVAEYAASWRSARASTWRPSTRATVDQHLDTHVLPRFGARKLRQVKKTDVRAWAASLTLPPHGLAPSYAAAVLRTFGSLLAAAVEDGRIGSNPASGVRVGGKRDRRVDPSSVATTAAAVPAIADGMPPRLRAAVLLMAATGLRLGECTGLTVDRIDFLRRSLRVDRQLLSIDGRVSFGPPKTAAGVRSIPLPAEVVDLLAEHVRQHGTGEHGLLFTTADGRPLLRQRWAESWGSAVRRAGLPAGVRTHDLRHVCASALIAGGLSVVAVQSVLGHASAAETLGVYSHLWPSDSERTREALAALAATWSTPSVSRSRHEVPS